MLLTKCTGYESGDSVIMKASLTELEEITLSVNLMRLNFEEFNN